MPTMNTSISNHNMSSIILQPITNLIELIANHVLILLTLGLVWFGTFRFLQQFSISMEHKYGAPTPDLDIGLYPSSTHLTDTIEKWDSEGCQAYTRSVHLFLRCCLYIPSYVTLISAVLVRSLSKLGWDQYLPVVSQLAALILLSDLGEAVVWIVGCSSPITSLTIVALADLCHQVKVVALAVAGISIFTIMILQSYLMPLLVISKASKKKITIPKKQSEKATAKKRREGNINLKKKE